MEFNLLEGLQGYLVLLDQYTWDVDGAGPAPSETYRRMWDILVLLAASFSDYFWRLVSTRVDFFYENASGTMVPLDMNNPNP